LRRGLSLSTERAANEAKKRIAVPKQRKILSNQPKVSYPLIILLWGLGGLGSLITIPLFAVIKFFDHLLLILVRPFKQFLTQSLVSNYAATKYRQRRYRRKIDESAMFLLLSDPLRFLFRPVYLIYLGIAVVTVTLVYGLLIYLSYQDLPTPYQLNDQINPLTTRIYDRHGKLLYEIYDSRDRTPVHLSELPHDLINATIAVEDKNYFAHPGVDLFGIIRASVANLKNEEIQQGGSTITQQLIKNTLLTTDRTWQRKVKEIFLALQTSWVYPKDVILEKYFNEAPYGGTAWGIESAAKTYFGKKARDLSLAESSYLAGLPASPTQFSPYGAHPERAKERQSHVLRRMVEDGYITAQQADEALKTPLNILSPKTEILAPHFAMYVRSLLEEKYGPKVVSQGGLKVVTSLDYSVQQEAEKIVTEEIKKLENLRVSNGAAIVEDARTGQILAMVGSTDYKDPQGGNFNVAIALRQPGSSIKPITYATAFKMGYYPGSIIIDEPTVFKNPWEVYAPVNYDGRFHGAVTIRESLGSSYNVPAVKTLDRVGIANMLQTAKDLGLTTLTDTGKYGLSLTLGAGEVKLVEMTNVYATFSQMGMKHQITPILKVTDSKGKVIEDNTKVVGKQVLHPGIAYMITDILADNKARTPAFGPNSLLVIAGHTVPVKTGTTDNKKDNWAFGYTPEVAVGVWVGNNNNTPMDPRLASGITGATPIWNRIMTYLVKDKANIAFARPEGVTEGTINGKKDLILTPDAAKAALPNTPTDIKKGDISYNK
jgi:1A family penicillin-binding protein